MQTAPFSTAAGTSSALAVCPDREETHVELGERLRGGKLHLELAASERDPRPRGPLRGKGAHVLVAALGQQVELHRADGAGGANDADPRHVLVRRSTPSARRRRAAL